MLRIVTPPSAILTATEVKARVSSLSSATDSLVDALVAAATGQIDGVTWLGRAIKTQTWDWILDDLPYSCGWPDCLEVPLPPLQSVTSVKQLDTSGVEQTFSSSNYTVAGVGGFGRVCIKSGASWPSLGSYPEALTVRFVAGYTTVPEPIKQAICLMVADLYAMTGRESSIVREDVPGVGSVSYAGASVASAAMNTASQSLLASYRVF